MKPSTKRPLALDTHMQVQDDRGREAEDGALVTIGETPAAAPAHGELNPHEGNLPGSYYALASSDSTSFTLIPVWISSHRSHRSAR